MAAINIPGSGSAAPPPKGQAAGAHGHPQPARKPAAGKPGRRGPGIWRRLIPGRTSVVLRHRKALEGRPGARRERLRKAAAWVVFVFLLSACFGAALVWLEIGAPGRAWVSIRP